MQLSPLDWSIVAAALATTLIIGFVVSKKASADSSSYFLAGRSMPWWLLGLSMVATTFSADTPNLVTDIVRSQGIAGNWVWWSMLITGMLTTFVYAKIWRRLGVTTDVEFYERRYSGKPARFLRGFRALYLGVFFNVMIMASVTLAAIKIGTVLFSVSPEMIVMGAGLITVVFSAAGGFLGVLITDMLLFVLAMTGSMLAAYYAVNHPAVGGLENLLAHVNVADKLAFIPDMSDPNQYIPLLLVPLLVQWWSVWYPGSEPGGGGYVAQRMLAAKNENHAVAASAFFNFCHYAVRPWPWILVALASLVVFPDLASLAAALPQVPAHLVREDLAYSAMLTFLPAGVLGIVVASLVSAYVSTISTSLNWGASYYVNDFYARFVRPDASDRRQVMVGRIVTAVLMVLAGVLALMLESAMQAFRLLLTVGAGTGLLFLLRWFWPRINAWSEIAAMVLSFAVSLFFEFGPFESLLAWQKLVLSVALTTAGWVTVTFITAPTDAAVLQQFQGSLRVQPAQIRQGAYAAALSTLGIYGALFTVGAVLFGNYSAAVALALATAAAVVLTRYWFKRSNQPVQSAAVMVD
ncbi:Na+:solute symporter [Exilibacterium tricleocarpae]|uniref:Na+:solute symporter n=1 Tax=Exilibacterium tricleocarpae TaxID=2591008 RepID=A0A545TNY1_9GAMM|nr:sodium:solute symporter family protein [Exilibacterium tricleocarpae]TQV78923.1 Na+:solute symporter [Exilibacterium tricleocarpae]